MTNPITAIVDETLTFKKMIQENNKVIAEIPVMVLSQDKCFDNAGKEYPIAQYHRFGPGEIVPDAKLVWQYQILTGVNEGKWFVCSDYLHESYYRGSGVHNTRRAILLPVKNSNKF